MANKSEKSLSTYFARASTLDESKLGFLTKEEWHSQRARSGAKKFKRDTLGFFKMSSVKTETELETILCNLKICKTTDEAREIIPRLYGTQVNYGFSSCLEFTSVKDYKGTKALRIEAYNLLLSDPYSY
jgi:hypothetical protein